VQKQSVDWKEKRPGVLSLVAFAILILATWQASSLIFAIRGPVDALLYWLFALTGIVRGLPYLLLVELVLCICLPSPLVYFLSWAWNSRAWNTLIRNLAAQGSSSKTKPESLPIHGVELVSVPFSPQQVLPSSMTRGFDWTNPYSPYKYAHWVALHDELREFMFELEIGPSIGIRFWVPHGRQSDDELRILCSSLQTSYGSLDLTQSQPVTIPAILGTPKLNPLFRRRFASFGNEFVSVILVRGIPGADSEGTQLDKLIHALTELEIRGTFVVHCSRIRNRLWRLPRGRRDTDVNRDSLRAFPANRQRLGLQMGDEQALGCWRVSAYLVVRTRDSELHLSKVKSAKIVLETTFLNPAQPIKTTILTGQSLRSAMVRVLRRDAVGRTGVLSSRQVSLLVHLPQQAQPGVYRKYSAEFEVPPERLTEIALFNAMKNDRVFYPVGIDLSHLTTHMVVVGQTGKGKTRFVGNLLQQVQKYPGVGITILDWKGEYRSLVNTVYAVGTEDCPLRINLFETHGIKNVEEYVQDLVGLLRELMGANVESSLSTQMERILRESLVEYLRRGSGNYEGYEAFLHSWIRDHEEQFSQPESSIAGLLNRFGGLFRGRLGRIFNTQATTRDLSALLRDRVCFDLSKLAAYSKEDARLFLNTLLMVLRTYLFQEASDRLRYLVIAEEAQYLIPEVFAKRSTAEASPAEDIALFQRAYGVGLVAVSTRPNLISRNILANSGCKILFQCPLDSDLLGDMVNLSPEQRQYLSQMPDRVVLAQLPWFEHPFKAQTREFQFPSKGEAQFSSSHTDQVEYAVLGSTERKGVNPIIDSRPNTIGPLVRHFLDLTCTALYNQGILHRIIRIGDRTAIDIPRHRTALLFIEDLEALGELDTSNLEELASVVVMICPPKLKPAILKSQEATARKMLNGKSTSTSTMVVPLTHNELRRLAKQIKTGQLTIPRATA
jgi:hypothetical protein